MARLRIENSRANDWEDVAIGPGPMADLRMDSVLKFDRSGVISASKQVQTHTTQEPD